MDRGVVKAHFTSEITLRQRRALVRSNGLIAHENDPPLESFAPERFDGLGTGQAGPHNHEGLVIRHGVPLVSAVIGPTGAPRGSELTAFTESR